MSSSLQKDFEDKQRERNNTKGEEGWARICSYTRLMFHGILCVILT